MEWATLPLKKYAEFTGRSRRKEYWMFVLLAVVVYVCAMVIDRMLGMSQMVAGLYGPAYLLTALALLVPSIAVSVRRLHDTDRSGWWLLIVIVPQLISMFLILSGNLVVGGTMSMVTLVCAVIVLVFMVLDGVKGDNRYGSDPKAGEVSAE